MKTMEENKGKDELLKLKKKKIVCHFCNKKLKLHTLNDKKSDFEIISHSYRGESQFLKIEFLLLDSGCATLVLIPKRSPNVSSTHKSKRKRTKTCMKKHKTPQT